jgi:ribosomal-protein-alanine N-acetyltransferase
MIATARLCLEELQPHHAAHLFDGLSNPRLYEFVDDQPPPTEEWLRSRYERLSTRRSPDGHERWLNWAIRILEGGSYAGYVQATVREDGSALLGYMLVESAMGAGYAAEAVQGMLDHLAAEGCVEARAEVESGNARSLALVRRLGFDHTGGDVYVRTLEP